MEDFFHSEAFRTIAFFLGVLLVLRALYRLVGKSKLDAGYLKVKCYQCRWVGTVGKYNQKCAKCGSTNLETLRG